MDVTNSTRQFLQATFFHALRAVDGRRCVAEALTHCDDRGEVYVVAIGKAAPAMALGALDVFGDRLTAGLVISKKGDRSEVDLPRMRHLSAGHPILDEASLVAGQALLAFIAEADPQRPMVFLISGGTSALVEVPRGVDLAWLQRLYRWLLGSGLPIHQVNAVRRQFSQIKGGRLLRYLGGRQVLNMMICDVPDCRPADIGSGLLVADEVSVPLPVLPSWIRERLPPPEVVARPVAVDVAHRIVADNRRARLAAAAYARERGWVIQHFQELVVRDCRREAARIAAALQQAAPQNVLIWGGEVTVTLPARPGRGGRNQALALAVADCIAGHDSIVFLAAGTDGSDGMTAECGAVVDGQTVLRGQRQGYSARQALAAADAGTFLQASGDLLCSGATGTNVMDLYLGAKVR